MIHKRCGFWDRRQETIITIGGPVEQILRLCSLLWSRQHAGENRVSRVVARFHITFHVFLGGLLKYINKVVQ